MLVSLQIYFPYSYHTIINFFALISLLIQSNLIVKILTPCTKRIAFKNIYIHNLFQQCIKNGSCISIFMKVATALQNMVTSGNIYAVLHHWIPRGSY